MNPKCSRNNECAGRLRKTRNVLMVCQSCRSLGFRWDLELRRLFKRLDDDFNDGLREMREAERREKEKAWR